MGGRAGARGVIITMKRGISHKINQVRLTFHEKSLEILIFTLRVRTLRSCPFHQSKKGCGRGGNSKLKPGKSANTTLHFFPDDPEGSGFRHPGSIALRSNGSARIFDCYGPKKTNNPMPSYLR